MLWTVWAGFGWSRAGSMRRLPKGFSINRRLIVADYNFGLKGDEIEERACPDTFDLPAPQRSNTVCGWVAKADLRDAEGDHTPHGIAVESVAPVATDAQPVRG